MSPVLVNPYRFGAAAPPSAYAAAVLADSPLWFPGLDETSGTTFADGSGNGRDGTWTASPTVVTGLVSDGGKARTFDGSTQYGTVPFGSWMEGFTQFTIEAVIKTTAAGGSIVARSTTSSAYRTGVTGGKAFVQALIGGTQWLCAGATTVNDNARHHIAGVWTGTTLIIYVDGVSDGTLAKSGAIGTSALAVLNIGQRASDSFFAGTMDAPALYGTALSATRLAAHNAAM